MATRERIRRPVLSAEEARQLHRDALVIDSQQPPATSGFLFTESMREAVREFHALGMTRAQATPILQAMAAREIQTSAEAREQYLDFWAASGVNVACGTYAGPGPIDQAFETSVTGIAQARAIVDALDDRMLLVLKADDIERAYREDRFGLVIDFQNTTPFTDRLERIDVFHNMGLRMCQLSYNIGTLVGEGCTEVHKGGLTYFGRAVVERLNELDIIVDVSHCSEQVGWDALDVSSAPVVVSHSCSAAVCYHDRGKSDGLAKAIADSGGFFGAVVIPGFIQETTEATLDDFVDHVVHLVNVMGIDHVGIGTDKAGPGPGTDSMIEWPADMPDDTLSPLLPGSFNYTGFRIEEHRLGDEYHIVGYNDFRDWPNLTVALADRGFNEEELRKLLGLNFLRVFSDVVG